ncbi:MAG: inositol monophosphatase, partial [Deltaproteobacteria bacterium]|nr:inositol monophosphatase [Deltaproteobacteria bacterium]
MSSISKHELELRLAAACAIAREAGDLARREFYRRDRSALTLKGNQDYLTQTDQDVEQLITGRLGGLFPDDGIMGEEGG